MTKPGGRRQRRHRWKDLRPNQNTPEYQAAKKRLEDELAESERPAPKHRKERGDGSGA